MSFTKQERIEAVETLKGLLSPGDTVFTTCKSVARSGMSRQLDLYVMRDNEPRWITRLVAKAAGYRYNDKTEALVIHGCGMDMGFDAVYNLGRALWPDGVQCAGDKCQSNDHANGDRDYTSHKHTDSGYALRQRWM